MTREEALQILDTIPTIGEQVDALEMAIQALSQEPCEDAISRHKAIVMITAYEGKSAQIEALEQLPSVNPQKSAKWIGIDEEPHEDYECNRCGYVCSTFTANIKPSEEYKYCPNCGAKMESEDKE